MEPVVHKLALSTKDRCIFLKCDLDLLSSLSRECEIAAGNEKCFPNFFFNFLSFLRVYSCMNSHLLLNPPVMRLAYLIVAVVFFFGFLLLWLTVPTFVGFTPPKENIKNESKDASPTFHICGKKEKELLLAVGSMVEATLRDGRTSRLEGAAAAAAAKEKEKEQDGVEEDVYVNEKKMLLEHHTRMTEMTDWKITKVLSSFPFKEGIDKNVGGVSGGVKLEVILCSGEICQKKIYKIYKNGTVV